MTISKPCFIFNKIVLYKLPFICISFLLSALQINAQTQPEKGLPFITNYRYQDYGAEGTNWWAAEDDNGVLYFANTNGVLTYDGSEWEVEKPAAARCIEKGNDGKMYVGATGDIGYLQTDKKGKLQFISLKDKLPEKYRVFQEVWEMGKTSTYIYFKTNNFIFVWDYKIMRVLESTEAFHITQVVNDQLYARIWNRGLTILKNDSFYVVPNGEKFANERIYVMLPYDDKNILVGTRTQGLFLYDGNNFAPFKTEADPYIVNTSLYGGLILSSGLIALNTFNNGMVIINRQGKLIQRVDKSMGLQDNSVDQLFEDSRGILWMPLFNGIAKFDLRSSFTFFDESMGLPAKTVFNVININDTVYAGTNNGVYFLDKSTNRFTYVTGTSGQVYDIRKFKNYVAVGGAEKGFLKISGGKAYPLIAGINYDFHVSQFIQSKIDSTVFYFALREGIAIVRYDPKTGNFSIESSRNDVRANAGQFLETEDGNLWVSGNKEGESLILIRPDRSNGKVNIADAPLEAYGAKNGLPFNGVTIGSYDETAYFVSTADSVFTFNKKTNRFIQDTSSFLKKYIGTGNGSDGTVFAPKDQQGRVWANYGTGVFVKIPTKDGSYKIIEAPFRELKKNHPVWTINPSIDKNGNTVVWFSGRDGIVRYDGNLEETTSGPFKTIIRKITLNEDSVFYSGYTPPADKPEFSHQYNSVRFKYAAPFFKQENETVFATLLEGRDKSWSEWNKQNFRDFGNLPAGTYTFRVKAKNIYDTEGTESSFTFIILPPWWASWWAYLLYAIAAAAVIYSLVRWRTLQLHEKHRELEKIVTERTAQLSERVEELAVINSVQQGLVSEMDIQGIYDLVGEKIREIFKAQVIDIVTYDKSLNLLQDRYTYEKGDRTLVGKWTPSGFRKHVIDSKQLLLINEDSLKKSIEFNSPVISGEPPKSAVWVPLISGNEVNGMISLQDLDKEHAFSKSDVNLLTTLANSMSVALESARRFDETNRLLKETKQRNAELAVINSVQESLVAQMDINSIYELVGEKIRHIFNAQVIDIVTYDAQNNLIEDKYAYEKGDRTMLGKRVPKGIRKHIIETGEILLHNENVEQASLELGNEVLIGEMPKSQVYVPMIASGDVKGIISLQNLDREHAFSDSDVTLITTLANSMSVALESARLFDETTRLLKETEQRNAELAVINSVQESLVAKMDIKGIYELVGEKIREIFDAQVIDIVTYDNDKNLIEDQYSFEKGDRTLLGAREPKGFRKHVIQTSQLLLHNANVEQAMHDFDNVVLIGEIPKSQVFVPMIATGKVKGIISLQNLDREQAFSNSDISLLTTLANSMSVALESARLFDETTRLLKETEQRTAELAVINSVQDGLAKELDIQGIYELVGDRILKLFDAQVVGIASFQYENETERFQYMSEKGKRYYPKPRPYDKLRRHLIQTRQKILINSDFIEAYNKFGMQAVSGSELPKSALYVPLSVGDKITSYVTLQNIDKENAFSDADVRLLETLSNSMSVALENARLFDETTRLLKETEQRTAELSVINSVQDGLAKELDIQGIYNLVGEKIREIFNAQVIDIVTYDPKLNLIEDRYSYEKGDRTLLGPREAKGFRKNIIETGQILVINHDFENVSQQYGNIILIGEQPKSVVVVPMSSGGKINGMISIQNLDHEYAFSDSDVNLLNTLANSMSVALESARLFDETNRLLKETEQRTAELSVINSVQQGLAKELDIQGIYELVGEKMREIFNAQVIDIVTYDAKLNVIEDRYAFEKGDTTLLGPREPKGIRKHIIDSGKLLVINHDYESISQQYNIEILYGEQPKAVVVAPMISGGKVNGMISLQNLDHEYAFSDSDISLLITLSNSMSVALESARLFDETNRLLKETEQRTAELSVINSVQEGLAKELDIQGIYELIGEKMREIFNAQVFDIVTYDKTTQLIEDRYTYEMGDRTLLPPRPLIGFRKHVIETGQSLVINTDMEKHMRELGNVVMIGEASKSVVFVPMFASGEVTGVISLQNIDQENAFSTSDVRLLTTLGNSMSVALESARLFDETNRLLKETEKRTEELSVINSVQEGLAKEPDINGIYELVGEKVREVFNAQVIDIVTYDKKTGLIEDRYTYEKGDRTLLGKRPLKGFRKHVIETAKTLLINKDVDALRSTYDNTVIVGQAAKSLVFVPMITGVEVTGVISLQNIDKENAFSDADVNLLTTFSNSMTVALENARLFDETTHLLSEAKQRATELSTVNSISKALASQLDADDLIKLVGDQLKDLFTANIVYLALLNKKTKTIYFPYQFGDDMEPMKLGEGLTSKIIVTGEPLLINKDVDEQTVQMGIKSVGLSSASYLGVPIPVGDEIIGVLSVQTTEQENRFNENDLRLLSTIASSVGVALRNATLFEDVKLAKMEAEAASKLAEKANEAKSAFLSTVSHELRTPLTSVLGFAKIIEKRLTEKIFPIVDQSDVKTGKTITQITDNLHIVISEGERLTHLINDVLDLAKIEAGKMEWSQEDVSMSEVAERAIAATTSLFDQKSLKLIKQIDENLPDITGDKDKLIQVIINLISNSVKFTDKGSITCKVSKKKNELVVSITDTGIGIAEEDFGAVFEQFKQVGGDTLTDKPKGTGLGLPICKEIVEHHSGRIWLESVQGKGSTFSFALPIIKGTAASRPIHLDDLVKQLKERVAISQIHIQGQASNILIVDDDDSIRTLLHQELGDAGYNIVEARNGKEALNCVRKQRPDLIILDIMMPEMNGFDTAAVLKNDPETMDIPIIVLSVVQDKARGFRIGIDRYLTKPIDTGLLFAEIGSLLEQGKSKKKVMIVDEDSNAVSTLTDVLTTKGYEVMEASENELLEKAVKNLPDIIIISSGLSGKQDIVKTLRFEKGLENVLFVVYQ